MTYNNTNVKHEYEMVFNDLRLKSMLSVYNNIKSLASSEYKYVILSVSKNMPGRKANRRVVELKSSMDTKTLKVLDAKFEEKTTISTYKEDIGGGLQIRHRTSSEIPTGRTEFSITDNPFIALKLRYRVSIGDWDYDFNIGVESNDIKAIAVALDDKAVTDDFEDFATYMESRDTHKMSIEVEYHGVDLSPDKIIEAKTRVIDGLAIEGGSVYDIHKISKLISNNFDKTRRLVGLTDLINKPVGLNKIKYAEMIPNITKYYLSPKLDGERCLVILGIESYALTMAGSIPLAHSQPYNTLLDAEMYDGKYIVFDLLHDNKTYFAYSMFVDRLRYLREIKLPDGFELQAFDEIQDASDIERHYLRYLDAGLRTDGLIFTPLYINSSKPLTGVPIRYFDDRIYKWKPPTSLTIDFSVFAVPANLVGAYPFKPRDGYEMYVLCCASSPHDRSNFYLTDIFPEIRSERKQVMFQTSIIRCRQDAISASTKGVAVYYHPTQMKSKEDLETYPSIVNTVSEFRVTHTGQMEFVRVRQDKTVEFSLGLNYGNNIRTAESIFFNALNPLSIQMMRDAKTEYFVNKKSKAYGAIKANNIVKDMLFANYVQSSRVVDLCCGKGQDLRRCFRSKVTSLVGIDSSLDALEEMNERKYQIVRNAPMKITLIHADLNAEMINEDKQSELRGDVILINFAIHYLVRDDASLARLVKQIDLLGEGQYKVIITCFDGKSVLNALDSNGEFVRERYHIKLRTKSNRGGLPEIDVWHHFSLEPITECLIDSDWLIEGFKRYKLKLVASKLFDSSSVSGEDKEYHNLYRYYVFSR